MKIGILTFHRAHNYGAVLQCYALQCFLQQRGHDVEIIDYRPDKIEKAYTVSPFSYNREHSFFVNLRRFISKLLNYKEHKRCEKRFDQFLSKYLNISDVICRKSNEIPQIYDAYILGSDQIWNPRILGSFDEVYMGQFPVKQGAKKIAYAASMGTEHKFDDEMLYNLGKGIASFDSISVREKSLSNLIFSNFKISVPVVVDPTLLVMRNIFDDIAIKPKVLKKYVLLFILEKDTEAFNFANRIAKQIDADVIRISAIQPFLRKKRNTYSTISPEEFCGWFKYAACIVSISFHGTAFSLIFKKDFYSLKNALQDRTENLLSLIGLSFRLKSSSSQVSFTSIDYKDVENELYKQCEMSISFLINSIANEK